VDNLESKLDELIKVYGEAGTRKHLSQLAGFAKEPPTITEFLEEDYFAGRFLGGHRLWPCWKETLGKIYGLDNPYGGAPLEICLSGGIGIGKSTCALAGMLYDLTRLLHLRSIQEHFSLLESTGIVVAFMNNTQKLAESNLFRQFNTWIQQSPFFQER
jgi:hypothetical protein